MGRINGLEVSTPSLMRFYDLTQDEFFISDVAARAGVEIVNTSSTERLVMLRYFGLETDVDAPEPGFAG
jgi:hypothetical protein